MRRGRAPSRRRPPIRRYGKYGSREPFLSSSAASADGSVDSLLMDSPHSVRVDGRLTWLPAVAGCAAGSGGWWSSAQRTAGAQVGQGPSRDGQWPVRRARVHVLLHDGEYLDV